MNNIKRQTERQSISTKQTMNYIPSILSVGNKKIDF